MSRGWLDKARGDLRAAEHPLDIEEEDYFAAEKYLKAFLVRHQLPFLETHDIQELLEPAAVLTPRWRRNQPRGRY